ncbi:hypothetical protein PH586_17880 [Pseudomonas sp. SA3-5]|uniref:Uncharacterized protein n=1 Tax=Pseudomonas aestuarii TaxID=3018340 RepID=A0ABT4XJF8_9PSED|nr:hypothetical protein [Pseudomonas aestuarii]MDA7088258.1 hypothetical protein [Pseudomonas aestuarii]
MTKKSDQSKSTQELVDKVKSGQPPKRESQYDFVKDVPVTKR